MSRTCNSLTGVQCLRFPHSMWPQPSLSLRYVRVQEPVVGCGCEMGQVAAATRRHTTLAVFHSTFLCFGCCPLKKTRSFVSLSARYRSKIFNHQNCGGGIIIGEKIMKGKYPSGKLSLIVGLFDRPFSGVRERPYRSIHALRDFLFPNSTWYPNPLNLEFSPWVAPMLGVKNGCFGYALIRDRLPHSICMAGSRKVQNCSKMRAIMQRAATDMPTACAEKDISSKQIRIAPPNKAAASRFIL